MPRLDKGVRLHLGRLEANVSHNRQKYWLRLPPGATVEKAQQWRTLKLLVLTNPNPAMCTALAEFERELRGHQTRELAPQRGLPAVLPPVPSSVQGAGSLFRDDVAMYLGLKTNLATLQDRQYHMQQWQVAFGDRDRNAITALEIRVVLAGWQKSGHVDPKVKRLTNGSLNKRRTALLDFYTTLNSKSGYNPVRDVPVFAEDKTGIIWVPTLEDATAAIDAVVHPKYPKREGTKTQIRLRLMLQTGWPQSTIMRIRKEHINWLASEVTLHGRRKGGGTRARTLPVNAEALAVLRQFDALNAYGEFDTSSMHSALARACKRVGLQMFNPYRLRHRFISAIVKASPDERGAAELALHTNVQQTRRYSQCVANDRATAALAAAFPKRA